MPVIRQQDAPLEEGKAQGINAELGAYTARLLSDAGGLTQFGAFVETLPPGSFTSTGTSGRTNSSTFSPAPSR